MHCAIYMMELSEIFSMHYCAIYMMEFCPSKQLLIREQDGNKAETWIKTFLHKHIACLVRIQE